MRASHARCAPLPAGAAPAILALLLAAAVCTAHADEALPGQSRAQASVTLVIQAPAPTKPPREYVIADIPGGGGGWDGGTQYFFSLPPDLPVTGAIAEVIEARGPDGAPEEGRLWIRASEAEGPFARLDRAVALDARSGPTDQGDGVALEFAFRTGWLDPAGRYTLLVALRPLEATGAGGIGESAAAVPADVAAGEAQFVRLLADVPELISVSLSRRELEFVLAEGAGDRSTVCDLRITVSTNARKWDVRCAAEPVLTPAGEVVAPERLEWARDAVGGWPAARGPLSGETIILAGDRPVEGLEVPLRLTLRPLPGDGPGTYRGKVSVVGVTGA
ncbi:MAG: hypothetical protein FJY75_06130 [Candidatus Eisenbacteria bacterium]|uniref:Uncharacterized protein n=1 Tax=Eiseniibacteriota bacterium TaxID=2212470 RepID=A0A937XCI8_UNCEI|nr:hypothetical protein [Candidatus Eisenbacteria bacterium]